MKLQSQIKHTFSLQILKSKVKLLESIDKLYTDYNKLGDTVGNFYSCLLTHTGQLHLRQHTAQLRLPHAGWPAKEQAGNWSMFITNTAGASANSLRNRPHCLLLPNHTLRKDILKCQKPFPLIRCKSTGRYSRS